MARITIHVSWCRRGCFNLMIETGIKWRWSTWLIMWAGGPFWELPTLRWSSQRWLLRLIIQTLWILRKLWQIWLFVLWLDGFWFETGQVSLESQELAEERRRIWRNTMSLPGSPTIWPLCLLDGWGDARKNHRLDPGMAFGTGTHPTTKMSLCPGQILRVGKPSLMWARVQVSFHCQLPFGCQETCHDLDDVAVRAAHRKTLPSIPAWTISRWRLGTSCGLTSEAMSLYNHSGGCAYPSSRWMPIDWSSSGLSDPVWHYLWKMGYGPCISWGRRLFS